MAVEARKGFESEAVRLGTVLVEYSDCSLGIGGCTVSYCMVRRHIASSPSRRARLVVARCREKGELLGM